MRLLSDGTLLMLSGGADLGTGLDTLTAKTAAEVLGLDMEDVEVVSGDTDVTPFDKGAYASSGTFFSGNAALRAAEDLRDKALAAAAAILGEAPEKLKIAHRGRIVGERGEISLVELAQMSVQGEGHHELVGAAAASRPSTPPSPTEPTSSRLEVNERTGEVLVTRYHAYQDCGTPINPALAKGQIFGGIMKAIGHSLYEEMIYDEAGRCLNPRFLDYKIPTIREVPADFHVELMPVPTRSAPSGARASRRYRSTGPPRR